MTGVTVHTVTGLMIGGAVDTTAGLVIGVVGGSAIGAASCGESGTHNRDPPARSLLPTGGEGKTA